MRIAYRRPSVAVLLLVSLLIPVGCESTTSGGVEIPRDGTIVYRQADDVRGSQNPRRNRFSSTTFVLTTQETAKANGQVVADAPTHVDVDVGTAEDQDPVKGFVRGVRQSPPMVRVIDVGKFQTLWRQLDAAGLFKLPRYKGTRPPSGRSYFSVRFGTQQWIFMRPANIQGIPQPDSPEVRNKQYWGNATRGLVLFVNQ